MNNAGVGVGGPFEYLDEADWRWVFDVNFFGIVALTKAALPLLETGRGRIVHIGSIGGRIASPGSVPYCASKHALEALAESQRVEFARSGSPIRVSLVEPGEVATAIWDKAEASVDDIERNLDAEGKRRYQWLLDQSRGFVDEGRSKGVPRGQGRRRRSSTRSPRTAPRRAISSVPTPSWRATWSPGFPTGSGTPCAGLGSKRWETRGAKLDRPG